MKKRHASVLALLLSAACVLSLSGMSFAESAEPADGSSPLVVGYANFSQKFSPFYADTDYDQDVVSMTQIVLMTTDRLGGIVYNGIEGETIPYNGTDYFYQGIADLSVNYDKEADKTVYTAKLRDDITFSDGVKLTADDVIFNYYVLLDPSYIGPMTLNSYNIVGYQNYLYNSSAAEDVNVTDEDVKAFLENPDEEMSAYIEGRIRDILKEEEGWCGTNYEAYGYPSAIAFFKDLYTLPFMPETEAETEAEARAEEDFDTLVEETIALYGTDYKALAASYAGDESYFDEEMTDEARKRLMENALAEVGGDPVDYISGIEKLDDYTVSVTTYGYEAPAIYSILGIQVSPMHYYGDAAKYDYNAHKFGFDKGDLSTVEAKTAHPLGAGPYRFVEYKDKVVYFEANEDYFEGAPKIQQIQFKEIVSDEVASGVQTGTIDAGEMSGSKTRFEEVRSYNDNNELSGDVITTSRVDNLGYGYIGLNAYTISVGGEPGSEASRNLRKALATVLSSYRDVAVESYYGDSASVIQYPISNTSWAAPQATDEGYCQAYSLDVDGNDIYASAQSAEEREEAVLQAAIGYLKAAGFTFDEASGKFTKAPEGARLNYEIIIPANGAGDHPAFSIGTDAKEALESIGIGLDINDPSDSNILWDRLDAGNQDLWAAGWSATIDPDLYQYYHSSGIVGMGGSDSNHYHIQDEELDDLIVEARQSDDQSFRKNIYKQCLDILMDWAVEIPIYQRQNCIIFSTERINIDTVTPDITTFYGWMSEIQNMEMN